MKISNRLDQAKQKYGWGELFLGLLISALFSPVLASLITPAYISIGLFPTPDLHAEVQQIETPYTDGMTVERFDNITWESEYEAYRVQFNHEQGPTLSRAAFEVRFPGCIKNTQVPGSNQGHGTITINSPLKPQLEAPQRPDAEIVGCTAQIITEDIHTHEGYTVEFVIDHTHSKCDLLSAYNPHRKFFVEYEWYENGQKVERQLEGEIQGAEEAFSNTMLPANSTKMVQKEDYSAYIYGAGNGDSERALSTCYGG